MPPQDPQQQTHGTLNPDVASPELVDKFLQLDEPTRTKLMAGWDDTRKKYMLAGLQSRRNRQEAAQTPAEAPPNTILGGFGRRAAGAVEGLPHLFDTGGVDMRDPAALQNAFSGAVPPPPSSGMGERLAESKADIKAGHPIRGALHAIPYEPLDEAEEGRYREALGGATFDAFSLWLGSKLGAKPSERARANQLHGAVGGDVDPIRQVMPDLAETAKQGGKPATVMDAQKLVSDTTDRLSAEFDRDFAAIKNNRIYTPVIRQRLEDILNKNPQWRKTPEGLAKRQAIQDAIRTYDRVGWTFEEMNKERGDLRTQIRSLNESAPSDAAAKLRVSAEIDAKKAVSDVMADTTNDWLSHATGKPKEYYDALRQKQARLIDLEDQLDKQVTDLHNKQATHERLGPTGRFKLHAYLSPSSKGFIRAHASGVAEALSSGLEVQANANVRQAFASSKHPVASSAVRSLPVSALAQDQKRKSTVPPPPEAPE